MTTHKRHLPGALNKFQLRSIGRRFFVAAFSAAVFGTVATGIFGFGVSAREYDLSELPKPPEELRRLIEAGDVVFEFDTERPSWAKQSAERYSLSGETKFDFKYNFQSSCRWRQLSGRSASKIEVSTRFTKVDFFTKHRVWLRRKPAEQGFWDSPLLRHELDHVLVSTDPRLESTFRSAVDKLKRLRLPASLVESQGMDRLNRAIKEKVESQFESVVSLARVRYLELDRLTNSGRQAIPTDSEFSQFISEAARHVKLSVEDD